MQLAIGKADFARVLASTGKAIEHRNNIPILSHVKLTASNDNGGTLSVTGTDLDIVATDATPADIAEPGTVCVDAKTLSAIVNKSSGDITLTMDDGNLIVKSGRSRFSLATLPAVDFPDFPEADYAAEFDLDIASFFAPVAFAISSEATRYYLNGVFFKGGSLPVAVATDGHRLGKHTCDSLPDFEGVIVPRKTVGLLPTGTCRVSVSNTRIRIAKDDLVLVSKLIDGTFPDYDRVIPKDNDKVITFDNDDMRAAVTRVSVIASDRGRAVKLAFAGGAVKLEVASANNERATDEIAAQYTGEPIEVGFNSAYLAELVGIFPDGNVQVALADPGSPAVFTSDAAEGLLAVLMPMRV